MNLPLTLTTEQEKELLRLAVQFNRELEDHSTPPFPKTSTLHLLKERLQAALFAQEGFADIWKKAQSQAALLCLMHENTAIRNLPWAVATEERPLLAIAKSSKNDLPSHQSSVGYPLKVLVMVASPEGVTQLAYEEEELQLLRAFAPLMSQGLAEVHFTDDGSLENLAEKLDENQYHILHFSGHGRYHEGQGMLALEDAISGQLQETSAAVFNEILENAGRKGHRPELVVLSACQTTQGVETGDLSGVADALIESGIPSVIAMSASILDNCAIVFAAKLYAEIFSGCSLATAFHQACFEIKKYEIKNLNFSKSGYSAGQWLIPQLLLGQEVSELANKNLPESRLNLTQDLKYIEAEKALANFRVRAKNHVFFGRRKEKRTAQLQLREGKSILLRGQGGVGKSTLAEHLVARMLASNPRFKVFTLSEKTPVGQSLLDQIQRYLTEEKEDLTIVSELVLQEKQTDKFLHLLKRASEYCDPIFIFDNVETFQKFDTEKQLWVWNQERHEDIFQFMEIIDKKTSFPLIITGRYPIAELPNLDFCNLNTIPHSDFFRKCLQLSFRDLAQKMPIGELNTNLSKTDKNDDTLTFLNVINLLHKTFGGNYRALEFFDELYTKKGEEIFKTLHQLTDFESKLTEKEVQEGVLTRMSENLVFEELLSYLNEVDKDTLFVLAQFNIPVLPMAIGMQRNSEDRTKSLEKVVNLTLVERQKGVDGRVRFYVMPLVRDLIGETEIEFKEKLAGDYHVFVSDTKISDDGLVEYSEAFERYFVAKSLVEINGIGLKLCDFYYDMQQFELSLEYGLQTEKVAKEETDRDIWNNLGLIFDLFGKTDLALEYYKKNLEYYIKKGDKDREGTALNNISQIHFIKGEYDTALQFLERCLTICHETEDIQGEGITLNNISQIYSVKGDYETTLRYLKKSLKIRQEIKDRRGESITLNNIGQIYSTKEAYDIAFHYYEQSLKICQEIEDHQTKGVTLNNLATTAHAKKDDETALYYYEQSLKICQEIGDCQGESNTLNNISQIHSVKEDYEIALQYLERSLKICKDISDINGSAITLWNIGVIHFKIEQFEEAIPFILKADQFFLEMDSPDKQGTENYLYAILEKIGEPRFQEIINNLNQNP